MSKNLRLLITGDIHIQRNDPYTAFERCRSLLHDADITYANLECSIIDRDRIPGGPPRGVEPRSDERMLDAYVDAGFNVVSLANNAAMYMGLAGLARTIELLDAKGIRHCGASAQNEEEAWQPLFLEKNGVRLALLSVTSVYRAGTEATEDSGGVAVVHVRTAYEDESPEYIMPGKLPTVHCIPDRKDVDRLLKAVADARARADVVIVSWHWGVHDLRFALPPVLDYQIELGRAAIDAGADLVAGHHAHALEGIEVYKGKAIFYSLGDLIHDEVISLVGSKRKATMVARLDIKDGKLERVAIIPGQITGSKPARVEFPGADEVSDVLALLREASARFGTRFDIEGDEVRISAS